MSPSYTTVDKKTGGITVPVLCDIVTASKYAATWFPTTVNI
jgi:hypothetical protein